MKVMKFGGTSLKDAERFNNAANIVKQSNDKRLIVVVSAPAGVTDILINASTLAEQFKLNEAVAIITELEKRILNIIFELDLNQFEILINNIKSSFLEIRKIIEGVELLGECSALSQAEIVKFGEYFSALILNTILNEQNYKSIFIDAREIIIVSENNSLPIPELIEQNISEKVVPLFKENNIIVTQGYIAADINGKTTNLGRGGSDYTASLIASAINANEIQIWTDVNGILKADPKKFKNAPTIHKITFREVEILSFLGAKVIHPNTIEPAVEKNIPVKVLNSFAPSNPGTHISNKNKSKKVKYNAVVGIAKCILFRFKKVNTLLQYNEYLQKFAESRIKIYHTSFFKGEFIAISEYSENLLNFFNSEVHTEIISLLGVVGNNFLSEDFYATDEFTGILIDTSLIDIKLFSLGISENLLLFGVPISEYKYTYKYFYRIINF